ncbi:MULTISPECIES: DUF2550 family protein [unclassified Ornithinimicrobium]|uniref:DUF2550 family protein n=1 Tax=unclassified Ornithinimicrobium TaxID=2615080 RepID=UPI0038549A42
MPDSIILVLLAALCALVLLGLGLVLFRTFGDQGTGGAPIPAAYRRAGEDWRRGTLRFSEDRLALRGPGGLSGGPWVRGNLDLGMARTVAGRDAAALGRPGLIQVPVSYGSATFDLALDERHYTALRAWVEAVPPGWRNSPVA